MINFRFLPQSLTRYALVGGSAYILEIAIIYMMQKAGADSLVAVALSFWFGFIYTFVLQKFFTFGDRRTHRKIIMSQALTVASLVLFNFAFTIGLTSLLQHKLSAIIIRTVAIGITTIWNFYLYRTRIFSTPLVD